MGLTSIMKSEKLELIVQELVSAKKEGSYWDFKREWYNTDEKGKQDMLHDIICMSNNLSNSDGYIVIGVNNQSFELTGVLSDPHRRTTQMMVDFLSQKPFAANVRPSVYVQTIILNGMELDVIVIENTNQTPYYLISDEGRVRANSIYTRILDSNTSKDSSADPRYVEALWRKRFRVDAPPLEKVRIYLQDVDSWACSPIDNAEIRYYSAAPEYTMETVWDPDRNGYSEFLLETAVGMPTEMKTIHFMYREVIIRCHQTVLHSDLLAGIDNNRAFAVVPERDYLKYAENTFVMFSLIEDSLPFLIHKHYADPSISGYYVYEKYFRAIIVFGSKQEKDSFIAYLDCHKELFLQKIEENIDIKPCITDVHEDAIKQYKGALVFKDIYNCWITEKRTEKPGTE